MVLHRGALVRSLAACAGAAGAVALAAGPAAAATPPVTPVTHVDLARYLGDWHQLAAIPALYELPCTGNSTAHYALNADGTVAVRNACDSVFGGTYSVVGRAAVRDTTTDAQLEVSFLNLFGQQIFFGSVNYVVIALQPDYSLAVVASPDHGSAFVLSRSAKLTATQTSWVQNALRRNGIDPCKVVTTPTTGGATASKPLC